MDMVYLQWIWRFPKSHRSTPSHHPAITLGVSMKEIINHQCWGTSMTMEPPICETSELEQANVLLRVHNDCGDSQMHKPEMRAMAVVPPTVQYLW